MIVLHSTARGQWLQVRVTPKASHTAIRGVRNGEVLVHVTVAPEDGKANAAVIALLADAMGIPKSSLELVSGTTARNKKIAVLKHLDKVEAWAATFPQGAL